MVTLLPGVSPVFGPLVELRGRTEPRLFTPPLRPLTPETSRGFEVVEFAELIGEPFMPWQRWLAIHGLEILPDGLPRFRTVLVLVARQQGKSTFKRTLSLWRLYLDGAKLILGVAQDVSLAREQWNMCLETIRGSAELLAELGKVRNVNGDEWFAVAAGGRYKISAANSRAGRGLSVDELNIDELRTQRDWDAWSALSKTTMARPRAQIWTMSNAGDDQSVVLNQLRESALSGRDPSIGIFEWSAPEDCDLDDPAAWAQANPALGYPQGVTVQAIRSALGTDPPNVFRTEVLCQRVDSLDSAIDLGAWKSSTDPAGTMDSVRDKVVACVDVAPDGAHVTLTAAAPVGDGRVRVEVVAAWKSTEKARFELADQLDLVGPRAVAWYPSGPAAVLGPILRGRPNSVELKGGQVTEACQGFADLVKARRIIHPGDPLLDAHVAGAVKLEQGDGFRFVRRGVGHVDAAYAAAGAVHGVLAFPEEPQPEFGVV